MATTETVKADLAGRKGAVERMQHGEFTAWEQQVGKFLGLKPSSPATVALFAICERYGLDPLLGHVVVMQDRKPYVTRDGYLYVAHESGQLDGIEVIQDAELADTQRGAEWVAKVAVHRKDMTHAFAYTGRYPAKGGNEKYAPEMAIKTAESMALRRAFPVTGLPSMTERWDVEPTGTYVEQAELVDDATEQAEASDVTEAE